MKSNLGTLNAHTPIGRKTGGRFNGWRWRTVRKDHVCGECGRALVAPSRAWMRGVHPFAEYLCGGCSWRVEK